jgi:CRISPR-associated protein Cmr6
MIQSLRNLDYLSSPRDSTNASLWLDKYLDREKTEPNQKLIDQVLASYQTVSGYQQYFEHWKEALSKRGVKEFRIARVNNRMAVNLGADSVLETNIALHHTYGVPYIPGSALKGLASHFADQYLADDAWRKGKSGHLTLFGDTNQAGCVTFFDALYIPNSVKGNKMLFKDVITVHHKEYYQSGSQPPADWDGTTIIPFLTATGSYLLALAGPDGWVEKAYDILRLALEKEGIGAKTSSGYGRMSFMDSENDNGDAPLVGEQSIKEKLLREFPEGNRRRGEVVRIDRDGEFGIIQPATGEPEITAHYSQIISKKGLRFVVGQVVEYANGSYRGRPQAQEVEILL